MHKLIVSVGKVFIEDKMKTGVSFDSPTAGGFSFVCEQKEYKQPYDAMSFSDEDIQDFIKYLQKSLNNGDKNEQNKVE